MNRISWMRNVVYPAILLFGFVGTSVLASNESKLKPLNRDAGARNYVAKLYAALSAPGWRGQASVVKDGIPAFTDADQCVTQKDRNDLIDILAYPLLDAAKRTECSQKSSPVGSLKFEMHCTLRDGRALTFESTGAYDTSEMTLDYRLVAQGPGAPPGLIVSAKGRVDKTCAQGS